MNQMDLFPDEPFVLGKSHSDDFGGAELWNTSGFGGPSIAEFLGVNSPYRVTGRQALEQAAALICLDVLAQDTSKATIRLKKRVKKGEVVVEPNQHPVAAFLALEPNPRHTWIEFKQMLVYHLAMASNCYALVKRDAKDDLLALVPVVPGRVQDRINERTGEIFYDFSAANVQEAALIGGYDFTAPERNVIHIRNRMLDGFFGYSTLLAGGPTLSMARSLDQYQRTLWDKDARISGVFVRPGDKGEMTDQAFRRMKAQLKKLVQRTRDDGDPILLEDGVTYQEMGMKANEAEMSKALDKAIEMICKLWRMPPHKVMHLTAVKYENLTAMEKVYVRDTLIPICRLIEERMARTLLTKEERLIYRFEFDRDEMAILDEKVENERVFKAVTAGLITLNEARLDQGYNPRKGGDVYVVQANTKLVDENGNVIVTGAKADPALPAPKDDEDDEKPEKSGDHLRLVASNE